VFNELITGGNHLLTMKYGPKWRRIRSFIHQQFVKARCDEKILPVLNAEAVQMMRDFMIYPNDFMSHPKRFTNSTLMSQGKAHQLMILPLRARL
jgi:cytochrome P450